MELVLTQVSPFLKSPQPNLGDLYRRILTFITHNLSPIILNAISEEIRLPILKDDIGLSFIRVAISLIAIKDGAAS